MPKGKQQKRYTGEFKQKVVEDMRTNKLGYNETMPKYEINDHNAAAKWERSVLWSQEAISFAHT